MFGKAPDRPGPSGKVSSPSDCPRPRRGRRPRGTGRAGEPAKGGAPPRRRCVVVLEQGVDMSTEDAGSADRLTAESSLESAEPTAISEIANASDDFTERQNSAICGRAAGPERRRRSASRYRENLCSAPLDARDIAFVSALLLRGLERRRGCSTETDREADSVEAEQLAEDR